MFIIGGTGINSFSDAHHAGAPARVAAHPLAAEPQRRSASATATPAPVQNSRESISGASAGVMHRAASKHGVLLACACHAQQPGAEPCSTHQNRRNGREQAMRLLVLLLVLLPCASLPIPAVLMCCCLWRTPRRVQRRTPPAVPCSGITGICEGHYSKGTNVGVVELPTVHFQLWNFITTGTGAHRPPPGHSGRHGSPHLGKQGLLTC